MNKKLWIGLVVIVLVIIAIVAFKKPATDTGAIKIGAVLSLTGSASADGEALKEGIEFAKETLVNKGVQVEIVYQDDHTEGKDTVSAINAVASQNIQAMIGPTWSFLGDAAAPTIDRLKLVSLMPVTTTEVVNGKSDYLFHGSIKNELMEGEFAQFIKDKNIKTIAYIGNNDSWSKSIEGALAKAADKNGAKIIIQQEVSYGSEAAAIPGLLLKVKQQNPDVIIFSIFDDQGIAKLVTTARQQNIMIPIVSTDTSLVRVIGEGLLGTTSLDNLYKISPKTDGSFEKAYEARYGKKPHTFADRGYDAVMILVDAIQDKKDMDLKDYLHTKTNYKGYATTYAFDMNGDVKGGEWQLIPIK
jgi:branched-chain amino acid transport system substrate-binding protein